MAKRGRKPLKKSVKASKGLSYEFKGRIGLQLRTAIAAMVQEGKTAAQAAQMADIKEESLKKALKKPHVLEYKKGVFGAMFNAETERSFQKMVALRDTARSEHVQAKMAETIASMDERFQPGSKVNKSVYSEIKITPGYVIELSSTGPKPEIQKNDNEAYIRKCALH